MTREDFATLALSYMEELTAFASRLARNAADAAEETLRLNQLRKEFGVGAVLERILAEQDLTRARTAYLSAVAEYDKAQYALTRAAGGHGLR